MSGESLATTEQHRASRCAHCRMPMPDLHVVRTKPLKEGPGLDPDSSKNLNRAVLIMIPTAVKIFQHETAVSAQGKIMVGSENSICMPTWKVPVTVLSLRRDERQAPDRDCY